MNDILVEEIQARMEQKDRSYNIRLQARASAHYSLQIQKGNWTYYVEEYEEKIRERLSASRGETNMSERNVLVRLSKDYQVVEVASTGITSDIEYEQERQFCLNQARELINQVGNVEKQVTKKDYQEAYAPKETKDYSKPSTQMNTRFAKGKQIGILQGGIDKGVITLEEVNGMQSWDDCQTLIGRVFASGKKKY